MGNLDIYNRIAEVPKTAQTTIAAGKLKGFTDINPMWRIKMLTEIYGPCGIGWYTELIDKRIEKGGSDLRQVAVVDINLYVKNGAEWSKPIFGTGGSMFVNIFKEKEETSDEAFKMAYTDALSVACKALGMGANVYWKNGRSKYSSAEESKEPEEEYATEEQIKKLNELYKGHEEAYKRMLAKKEVTNAVMLTYEQAESIINAVDMKKKASGANA